MLIEIEIKETRKKVLTLYRLSSIEIIEDPLMALSHG